MDGWERLDNTRIVQLQYLSDLDRLPNARTVTSSILKSLAQLETIEADAGMLPASKC